MEPMRSKPNTYGRISEILHLLGFERYDGERPDVPPFSRYDLPAKDSVIILPQMDADALVRPVHIVAVRSTLRGMGIASEADFEKILKRRAASRPRPPVVPAPETAEVAL